MTPPVLKRMRWLTPTAPTIPTVWAESSCGRFQILSPQWSEIAGKWLLLDTATGERIACVSGDQAKSRAGKIRKAGVK